MVEELCSLCTGATPKTGIQLKSNSCGLVLSIGADEVNDE